MEHRAWGQWDMGSVGYGQCGIWAVWDMRARDLCEAGLDAVPQLLADVYHMVHRHLWALSREAGNVLGRVLRGVRIGRPRGGVWGA